MFSYCLTDGMECYFILLNVVKKVFMEIKRFGYYWLDTWILANVIQLANDYLNTPQPHPRKSTQDNHSQNAPRDSQKAQL